jgi:hypothetical protein
MTDEHRTYDRWSDNDLDIADLLPPALIPRYIEQSLSADDCCAIATIAVAAGMNTNAQAPGVARMLMRSYRASPSFRFEPEDGPTTFAYRPTTYDRKHLRAVAVRISAATYGHEDPSLLSQQILQAVLDGVKRPSTSAETARPDTASGWAAALAFKFAIGADPGISSVHRSHPVVPGRSHSDAIQQAHKEVHLVVLEQLLANETKRQTPFVERPKQP